MSMGEIVGTVPLGNNGGNFWGDALGAVVGGAIGGAVGSGWRNGGGYGGGGGQGPVVINSGGGGGGHGCSSAELDALTGLQASVNGVGLAVVQGQNATNMGMCQGFSGVVNASNQGFAGLNNAISVGDAAIQQSLCQGFGGLNTAVLTASKDTALQFCQNTNALAQAISDCCCKTQQAIAEQGQLTRDLINQRAYNDLQEKYCDAKSKISSLETQAAFVASQQMQTAQIQQMLAIQLAKIGTGAAIYRAGRIDERDSTAADGGAAAG